MRLHRLPPVLVLHIKRFKFKGTAREKLTTNVTFPLRDLQLTQFVSEEAQASGGGQEGSQSYDLFAVSHHYGNMVGGHYTATCMVPPLTEARSKSGVSNSQGGEGAAKKEGAANEGVPGGTREPPRGAQWWTFNDDQVSRIAPQLVVSNTAYMLFYVRRDCGADAAAAAAAVEEGA